MKPEPTHFSPLPSKVQDQDKSSQAIDRRRFLHYAAAVSAMAGFRESILSQPQNPASARAAQPNSSESRLPNGSEFPRWEQPLKFTKTYYVDNQSSHADDSGPGSKARPFRTINRAAQVLRPGERVVIAAGTYRECIRPVRGGASPTQMISYEAAPGAEVIVKGSAAIKDGWQQESVPRGRYGANGTADPPPAPITAWRHELTGTMFPDAYQPFALPSNMGSWQWLNTAVVDMGPYLRRRGLVFVDGKPLEPMEQLRELAQPNLQPFPDFTVPAKPQNGLPARQRGGPIMQEVGGTPNARFWVEDSGTAIHIRLASGTPADHLIEVTTHNQVFVPAQKGLPYIRIKGIRFQHAGNAYPFPQYGLVSTAGGNHWIIEDNVFEWANGVGLDMANDGGNNLVPQAGDSQIIRRNTIRYCGVEGVAGMSSVNTVVEDNLIEWCGWADAERGAEASGAKFHRAHNLMFRRNVVRHMRHATGIWLDSSHVNCRVTSNIFADILSYSAAVKMEMNVAQNQVDNNIIWDVRNAEPGTPGQYGCAGSGVFIDANDHLIVAQNLIGRCDNSGIFTIIRPDRRGSGTAIGNNVSNDIIVQCGRSAIVYLNADNQADGNFYASMPKDFQGLYTGNSKRYMDLAAWREHGWDKNSIVGDAQIDFDSNTLELTIASSEPFPTVSAVNAIDSDFFGKPVGNMRAPGPLAGPGSARNLNVDPRRSG